MSYVNNMDTLKRNAIDKMKRQLSINNCNNLYQTSEVENMRPHSKSGIKFKDSEK